MRVFDAFLSCGSVCTDTRAIAPGSVFFALKGASFNGNAFAMQALAAGASYAVVDEYVGEDERLLLVADVLTAMQQCARDYRRYLNVPTLGLTEAMAKRLRKSCFMPFLT